MIETRWCARCARWTGARPKADGSWACGTCLHATVQSRPVDPAETTLDRDCPRCGAPEGEWCVYFDASRKGRGSWGTEKHLHDERV